MDNLNSKQSIMAHLISLEMEIQKLAQDHSLATLEHKLKQRQDVLEHLFSQFLDEINNDDMKVLKDIQAQSQALIEEMQASKHDKSQEIIKYKNTGKRIRLYTDIAQHK